MATITTTKTKAPTQKEMFTAFIKFFEDNGAPAAYSEFCAERIDKLAKKSTSASAKKDEQNEKFFDAIADVLADGKAMRASEIHKALLADDDTITIQKVTAMLKKMAESGRVTKTVEKKVTYFALAFGVEDTEGE